MTETFTLAHFTDVHLSPITGFTPHYWNPKRMLGLFNWHTKRRGVHKRAAADRLIADAKNLRADHIAITGDLINLGLPQEYEAARDWLTTVGPAERVTVIPGNHDIYSSLHGDIGIGRWADYMGGDADTHAFPFVRRIGPLALIGLNSAVETPPFVAAGRLGPDQIEVTRDLLERLGDEGLIRVVLIHHPPLAGLAPRAPPTCRPSGSSRSRSNHSTPATHRDSPSESLRRVRVRGNPIRDAEGRQGP